METARRATLSSAFDRRSAAYVWIGYLQAAVARTAWQPVSTPQCSRQTLQPTTKRDCENEETLLGGLGASLAPAWATAQPERVRVIGVLLSQSEGDQEAVDRLVALRDGLQKRGWIEGGNIRLEIRYAGGSVEHMQAHAAELVRLRPDVLFAAASSAIGALKTAATTTTIPIVASSGNGYLEDVAGQSFLSL